MFIYREVARSIWLGDNILPVQTYWQKIENCCSVAFVWSWIMVRQKTFVGEYQWSSLKPYFCWANLMLQLFQLTFQSPEVVLQKETSSWPKVVVQENKSQRSSRSPGRSGTQANWSRSKIAAILRRCVGSVTLVDELPSGNWWFNIQYIWNMDHRWLLIKLLSIAMLNCQMVVIVSVSMKNYG